MTDPFFLKKTENSAQNQLPWKQISSESSSQQPIVQSVSSPGPTSPVKIDMKVKQWNRVSFRWFLIWCGIFMILFVGLIAFWLYYFALNPQSGAQFWLSAATIKNLLTLFALLFFGFVFFIGFWYSIVNGYRLMTVKEWAKGAFILGLIFGVFLLLFSLWAGVPALTRISSIEVADPTVAAGRILLPYYQLADGREVWIDDPNLKKIAPAIIVFKMGKNSLRQLTNQFPSLQTAVLNCGNGQTFDLGESDPACFFTEKKAYPLTLEVGYLDANSRSVKQTLDLGPLSFDAQLDVSLANGVLSLNDSKSELVAGFNPSKVLISAQRLFSDLQLATILVDWDTNGDLQSDFTNEASVQAVFNQPGLQFITYSFPALGNYRYVLPLRIKQSESPVCSIDVKEWDLNKYQFSTLFEDSGAVIKEFSFEIINASNGKSVASQKTRLSTFDYSFKDLGSYFVRVSFLTDTAKQWGCESQPFDVGSSSFNLIYRLLYRAPQSSVFQKFSLSGRYNATGDYYVIPELPTTLQFVIDKILPENSTDSVKVFLNDQQLLSSDGKTFEFVISKDSIEPYRLVTQFVDQQGNTFDKNIVVSVKQQPIVGIIKVDPSYVGTDPFEVHFDASSTRLADETDEIVFFTRNFGDGEVAKNVSKWQISHTYVFDNLKESGSYHPEVTIKTRKWLTGSFFTEQPISVKRAERPVKILMQSHPAQVALAGERVQFGLEVNGPISTIIWNFWDGQSQECEGRSCIEMTKIYDQPGTYTIKVTVKFEDSPSVEQVVKLQVR